ncbi:uncharacterized protein SCHCODRAFT_02594114 [Schizophyllum commune H4-8]|nr:uncharacterized protein SCHCODRAFT_02594114 [Schizophyllum commune H4-8]KAI5885002.1 hypothetical protein SCHCODRAFT_02594114 [Schizophyllum commune H4-8]
MKSQPPSIRDTIIAMAAKYSEGLPGFVGASTLPSHVALDSPSPLRYPITVLLTGSTGHLGSEILALLLTDKRVERVYTLDRVGKGHSLEQADGRVSTAAGVRERQRARWADRVLDRNLLKSSKLVSLVGDASAARLGQSEVVYEEMLASVSTIIHTAWLVNFNLPLIAFEPSFRSMRALIDFARQAELVDQARQDPLVDGARRALRADGTQQSPRRRTLRFLFASSVTAVRSWEDVVADFQTSSMLPDCMPKPASIASAPSLATAPAPSCAISDSTSYADITSPDPLAAGTPNMAIAIPIGPAARVLATACTSIRADDKTRLPIPDYPAVPEVLIDNPSVCIDGLGYGQSKFVAERILAASGIEFASVRIGQLCGGSARKEGGSGVGRGGGISVNEMRRGAWVTTNWFPMLVKTSLALGALPTYEQMMPWLPMDAAAQILLDIAFSSEPLHPSYNLMHPRPISFAKIMEYVQWSLASTTGQRLPCIPFKEWLARLENKARRPDIDQKDLPGIKIISFLHDICSGGTFGREFEMEKAEASSPTLCGMEPINQADVGAWVSYWEACGMFARKVASSRL